MIEVKKGKVDDMPSGKGNAKYPWSDMKTAGDYFELTMPSSKTPGFRTTACQAARYKGFKIRIKVDDLNNGMSLVKAMRIT